MKKSLYKSIQTELLVCFLTLTVLIIGSFVFVSIIYSEEGLKEDAKDANQQLIEQVALNIENNLMNMDMILETGTQQKVLNRCLDNPDREEYYEETKILLSSILNSQDDFYSVAVLDEEGNCIIMAPDAKINEYARINEKKWFKRAQQSNQEIVLTAHVQNLIEGKYQWVVTASKKIPDAYRQDSDRMMIIDLKYDVIRDFCTSIELGEKGYLYILDENGRIIYHPQQQLILGGIKQELTEFVVENAEPVFWVDENGEEKLYTSHQSEKTGWTVVGVEYVSEILEGHELNKAFFLSVANEILVTALIAALIISRRITRPIKNLKDVMQKVQKDDFEPVHVKVEGRNEISDLCISYNRMITYMDELLESNIQKAKDQQASEMKALQSQINPHFLYNTLDSIIWMIETDDQEQAIRMTSALAKFFRKAIGNGEVFVTIEEELEYTKQYLIIQRMRYKDKIDFDIQVDPDIKMCPIIKLVLQPLVENALYHGLKYKKGKGLIRIIGYRSEDKIILKVSDNGIGMDQKTINHLFVPKDHEKGIGLSNVQSRIQLYYGTEFGLQVESEKGIGTTVTVVIPENEK